MKHREKEHLKKDPLVAFVDKAIHLIQSNRREIMLVAGVALFLVLVVLLVLFLGRQSVAKENSLLRDALTIKSSVSLNIDQKIKGLNALKPRRGVSAVIPIFVATLYFEKGEMAQAKTILSGAKNSSLQVINDQKQLLLAEIAEAEEKNRQAIELLNAMIADAKTQLNRDFLLLQLAKIQQKDGQLTAAADSLRRILNEFPTSLVTTEAKSLLETIVPGS